MGTTAFQTTSLTIVYSTIYSGADQRKHQSSASLAFVWGSHRDRWIPRTKGQLLGKCFHFIMTSSWQGALHDICNATRRGGGGRSENSHHTSMEWELFTRTWQLTNHTKPLFVNMVGRSVEIMNINKLDNRRPKIIYHDSSPFQYFNQNRQNRTNRQYRAGQKLPKISCFEKNYAD